MSKIISIFCILLIFCNCSTTKEKTSNNSIQVISMEKEFKAFWEEARNENFEEQYSLWNKIIEKPHQEFFDEIVWSKKYSKEWEKYKKKALKEAFKRYKTDYKKIITNFESFPKTLRKQIKFYRKKFADAEFKLPIYAAVAPTFNGRVADLNQQDVLAFSMDMMVHLKDNPDTLYAHELFHVYQNTFLQLSEESLQNEKFSLLLWTEGFATYIASDFHPRAKMSDVFMSKDLANLETNNLSKIADMFLKDIEEPALDMKNLKNNRRWFSAGSALSKKYPSRVGYWLGYHVIKELSRKHELEEMVRWNPKKLHLEVKKQLANLK